MSKEKKIDANKFGEIRKLLDEGSFEKLIAASDLLDSHGAHNCFFCSHSKHLDELLEKKFD
ncbi:hypothetical protein OAO16_03725 [Opitutales bacterium]|nr:hypothetical protein [Opitutales bacterium]